MTRLRVPSRRSRRLALLAAAGVVIGGAYAVRRHRRQRDGGPPAGIEAPLPQPTAEPAAAIRPDDPDEFRPRVRPGFVLALILVLVLAALTAMHLADDDTVTLPDQGPWSEHGYIQTVGAVPIGALTPPRTTWAVPTHVPEPLAAVMPDSVLADGMSCTPGADRPVLDTVRPVLTARLTEPAPIEMELTKEDDTELLPFDRTLTASEDGHVALYLRRDSRLERSGSYRWRVRAEAGAWSPWCRFSVAATTPDSLGLDDATRTVGLPPSKWREIRAVLDDPLRFQSIGGAGARVSAGDVGVDMGTRDWETLLELMAERASAINDPELWRLVDTVSVKVGGPPHPTLGFPRA